MESKKTHGFVIKPLSECPKYAAICAHWAYSQWFGERDIAFDINLLAYEKRAEGKGLPQVLVACLDTFPVGMVSLKEKELWSMPEQSPWLSSLYVEPKFRKSGFGDKLIEAVKALAVNLGYGELYLFLGQSETNLEAFYEKRGWRFKQEALDNDGSLAKVYGISLL